MGEWLLCFFGIHDWTYSYWPSEDVPNRAARVCNRCLRREVKYNDPSLFSDHTYREDYTTSVVPPHKDPEPHA